MTSGVLTSLADRTPAPGLAAVVRSWCAVVDDDPLTVAQASLERLVFLNLLAAPSSGAADDSAVADPVRLQALDAHGVIEAAFLAAARHVFRRDARRP